MHQAGVCVSWEHMFVPVEAPKPWLQQTGRPAAGGSVSEARVRKRHGLPEYQRYRSGKRGFRWRCKRCVGEAVTRRHQKVKRALAEQAEGCCAVCGYSRCIVNLQFHHVDPRQKSFRMSMCAGKALATYEAEPPSASSSAPTVTARSRWD